MMTFLFALLALVIPTFQNPDLEKAYQEMAQGVSHSDTTRHLQIGMWCEQKGLIHHMLPHLDRALAAKENRGRVREILKSWEAKRTQRAGHTAVPMEQSIPFWVLVLADRSPSKSLHASVVLESMPENSVLPILFKEAKKNPNPKIRRGVIRTLGAFEAERVEKPLVRKALLDKNESVRMEAVQAIKGLNSDVAQIQLTKSLGHEHPAVRIHAAEALGELGDLRAAHFLVEALRLVNTRRKAHLAATGGGIGPRAYSYFGTQTSYIRDFDVQIAQAAAIADPIIGVISNGTVLDVRIHSIEERKVISLERKTVHDSLERLMGRDLGYSPKKWTAYLEEQNLSSPVTGTR